MCAGTQGDHTKAPKVAPFSQFWGTYKTPLVLHFLDNGAGPVFLVPNIKVPLCTAFIFRMSNDHMSLGDSGLWRQELSEGSQEGSMELHVGELSPFLSPQKYLLNFFVLFLLNPNLSPAASNRQRCFLKVFP